MHFIIIIIIIGHIWYSAVLNINLLGEEPRSKANDDEHQEEDNEAYDDEHTITLKLGFTWNDSQACSRSARATYTRGHRHMQSALLPVRTLFWVRVSVYSI